MDTGKDRLIRWAGIDTGDRKQALGYLHSNSLTTIRADMLQDADTDEDREAIRALTNDDLNDAVWDLEDAEEAEEPDHTADNLEAAQPYL